MQADVIFLNELIVPVDVVHLAIVVIAIGADIFLGIRFSYSQVCACLNL